MKSAWHFFLFVLSENKQKPMNAPSRYSLASQQNQHPLFLSHMPNFITTRMRRTRVDNTVRESNDRRIKMKNYAMEYK